MTEENKSKPIIEDAIPKYLDSDKQKTALDFVAYLRENKMSPQQKSGSSWKIVYKTFNVCFIQLTSIDTIPGTLQIIPIIGEYEGDLLSDEMKELVWENQKNCPGCNGGRCRLKINKIFGKEYESACEVSIKFNNPDINAIECIKKIIEIRRNEIKEGKAKKFVYVAIRNR